MRWRLKWPSSRLFTQPFVQAKIKENIKAPRHWPLCGEFTGDRWIPRKRASNAENVSIWWRHHGRSSSPFLSILSTWARFGLMNRLILQIPQSHIQQRTIQNRNIYIWIVHCGIWDRLLWDWCNRYIASFPGLSIVLNPVAYLSPIRWTTAYIHSLKYQRGTFANIFSMLFSNNSRCSRCQCLN